MVSFTAPLQPFHKSSSMLQKLKDPPSPKTAPSTFVDVQSVHTMANSFQTFYNVLEEDLHKQGGLMVVAREPHSGKDTDKSLAASSDSALSGPVVTDGSHSDNILGEKAVKEALERMEACIAEVFYDQ